MIVCAVDPGFRQSAYVTFDGSKVLEHDIVDNEVMLTRIETARDNPNAKLVTLVVEQISMGGMIAGAEIFETCFISGRFVEMWSPRRWARVKRTAVKMHLCGQMRAKDANIRQALLDRFGPDAQGVKAKPGPLYKIHSHEWAALAVAVTYYDQHVNKPEEIRPGIAADF